MTYTPPQGNLIAINFDGVDYMAPQGNLVALDFSITPVVGTDTQYTFPSAFNESKVSSPLLSVGQFVRPDGFDSQSIGDSTIWRFHQYAAPKSIAPSAIPLPRIENFFKEIYPSGVARQTVYGRPLVYNLKQFIRPYGYDQSRYGKPYMIGGVRWLYARGHNSNDFGDVDLVNTTANQGIKPKGIDSFDIPKPSVSPRILYAKGFDSLRASDKHDVRTPVLLPAGFAQSGYGAPTIWFHTRTLEPDGIQSYASGLLRIADPTQFVQVPSLIETAIFGDTVTKNSSSVLKTFSINDGSFSDYNTFTNSNRTYTPNSIDSLSMGAPSVNNKTPSIFVDGVEPCDLGMPAIGYAIRLVMPTGFDHLSFGRAILTKTPELLVSGHQSSRVGTTTVWHKNRNVDLIQKGINGFNAGSATAWYGQRSINSKSWRSSKYGQPALTHQLRGLLTQGFRRDIYGTPWISQGIRRIEPVAIYKDFASNHIVGGTQTIVPAGYEATLWGERIVPNDQRLFPFGFGELWGDTSVDLYTKYIAPVGYISVGQQPADRWGDVVVYNKLQYIVQEFDINSGLSPPSWPDYMLIENRNKTIGVTAFSSQRFGYSQIDNNAAPLLPFGIEPPAINIGMISHGVRAVLPKPIEPPPISTWGVTYNDGRVTAPLGFDSAVFGNNGTVANTRREYRNVGRIESLETGTPMIAYRIRTIDIEPRYSIAPPQIDLPTIDLHTKYIGFNGYETVKYGTASLSIHFNIIGPSWNHRDDFGYGAVRNVTPELQVGAFDSQEFGRASIRTQWRHVKAQGDTATLFGSAKIADTKQDITIRGWQDGGSSQKHAVIKTGAPPYTPQNIWLHNESNPNENGFGITPSSKPSEPGLNQNVVYARGHNSQKFGDAFVWSNNLYIEIGISTRNIERGPSVMNKRRFIDVEGMDYRITVSNNASVTPHYIKPKSFNQPYDSWTFNSDDKFGRTRFTNQHRGIYPRGHRSSNVGYGARITLKDRYIEPTTIRGFAMGFPEIPFTLKTINMTDYGFNSERHGATTVKRPPYTGPQTLAAKGFNNLDIGANRVELLNRRLLVAGINSVRMGRSLANDTPYMWQGLRVGEFVPMKISAGDTSVFGETRIGLRVREISLEGFVAFKSEYEITAFDKRMKVTGTVTDNSSAQSIAAVGIDSSFIGTSGIKWGQQFIRPDGNSDQFRKGAF